MRADACSDRAHTRRSGKRGFKPGAHALLLAMWLAQAVSCTPKPAPLPPTPTPVLGILDVDINYAGKWYRDTFGYARDAKNIRHYVLVVPEDLADRASAGEIFSSLGFAGDPEQPSLRQDRQQYAWALEFLHAAPGGHFRGELAPGTYQVAVAFVAAPLTREEAGVPDDTILYAGITGGGASEDYRKTVIQPGENTLRFTLTDKAGWACPWLYVLGRHGFERRTEILRNLRGKANDRTEFTDLGPVEIFDGVITLKVAEERDEVAHIDQLLVVVDGISVAAEPGTCPVASLAARDEDYLSIIAGEACVLRYRLPSLFSARARATTSMIASGFYVPAPD